VAELQKHLVISHKIILN